MTDEIVVAEDLSESETITVADAVATDDAELLFAESNPRGDHSLDEFGAEP